MFATLLEENKLDAIPMREICSALAVFCQTRVGIRSIIKAKIIPLVLHYLEVKRPMDEVEEAGRVLGSFLNKLERTQDLLLMLKVRRTKVEFLQ